MSHIWIIHTGAFGNIDDKVIVQTKHKHLVGKFIRENLSEVFFMFQKLGVCDNHGQIKDDLMFLYNHDNELDFYSDDDKDEIIERIHEVLKTYSNKKIVDELYGTSSDTEKDYCRITKISTKDIIEL